MAATTADPRDPLNAMTIDVEEHFQVSAFEGVVRREDWESQPSRVEANTSRVLDTLEECGVLATFFVLGWVAERRPSLVRRIAEQGHEIASHGYSHRLVHRQTPDEFRREVDRSRKTLQDQSGQAVEGHRAASFSIGRRNLWALDVLVETGFAYDSSLFPVRHDVYGVPGAPRGIHRLRAPGGGTLVEVPPSTVEVGHVVLPVGGGGYLRLYPASWTRWGIRRLNRREKMPAMVYVHPWELDPEQPRQAGLSLKSRFRHYVNLDTTRAKLRDLMRRHRFGRVDEVIRSVGEPPVHLAA